MKKEFKNMTTVFLSGECVLILMVHLVMGSYGKFNIFCVRLSLRYFMFILVIIFFSAISNENIKIIVNQILSLPIACRVR